MTIDRRNALKALGLLAAAPLVSGWRTPGLPRARPRIGLAVYTVRDRLARDFEGTLRAVAEIGYRDLDMYIQAAGRSPKETRAILDRVGLACPSARVATLALYRGWDRFLDAAGTLGARYVTVANVSLEERLALVDWRELADVFNTAGERARRAGLTLCYHNHSFELDAMEGQVPLDLLLASTDPALVKLQMDVYWMSHGRRDPVAAIERLGSRVATLHLKDMDATPARGITTVGRGTIDFARVLAAAETAGVTHAFVEEDDPADALAAIRASYQHLAGLR